MGSLCRVTRTSEAIPVLIRIITKLRVGTIEDSIRPMLNRVVPLIDLLERKNSDLPQFFPNIKEKNINYNLQKNTIQY